MNDDALLRSWIAGDAAAGQALTHRHYEGVFYFFSSKVDPVQVEDLVHATFLALFENIRSRGLPSSVRAYLFGIARIKLIEYYRLSSKFANRFRPLEHSVADVNFDRSMTSLLDARDELSRFYDALRTLPFDTQLLVELRCYFQFSEQELGDMFETTPTAIRARLVRARRRLRKSAQPESEIEVSVGEEEMLAYFQSLRERSFE